MGVPVNFGSMSEKHEQIPALSRQLGQLAARIAEGKRNRADEIANAAATRVELEHVLPPLCLESSGREVK